MKPLQLDHSLRGPLLDIMTTRYPSFAQDLGLRLTHTSYDPQSFGNSVLLYESDSVRLRIVTDRSQVFAELALIGKPEIWWTVQDLFRLIHNRSPELDLMLDSTIAFLNSNFVDLVRALGPDFAEARRHDEARKEQWNRRIQNLTESRHGTGHAHALGDGWFQRLLTRFRI